jgi:hypothetical protein
MREDNVMGQIISAECKQCGFHKDYFVGAGLGIQIPGVLSESLCNSESHEWDNLYARRQVAYQKAEKVLMKCPDCGDIVDVVNSTVSLVDGGEIKLGLKCRKCEKPMNPINIEHIPCPKCGAILETAYTGNWD